MTLADLVTGDKKRIQGIQGEEWWVKQFEEMGFVPGTECEVILRNSGRGPIAVGLKGAVIAVRYQDARNISII